MTRARRNIPIDAYEISRVINLLLNFFGLSAIVRKNNDLKWKFSATKWALRIVISTLLNVSFVYGKIKVHNMVTRKIHFGDLGQMLFVIGYVHYIIDLLIVYRTGEQRVRYYKIYNYVDDIIGKRFYVETKRTITKMFIFIVSAFLFAYLNDFFVKATYSSSCTLASILNTLDIFNSFFIVISITDQISSIFQVKNRLKYMGDILEEYHNSKKSLHGVLEEAILCNDIESLNKIKRMKDLHDCRYFEILWFKKCYLMLLEQVGYINSFFGLKGLISVVMLLIFIVTLFNILVSYIFGVLGNRKEGHLTVITNTIQFIYYMCLIIYILICCEQTYRQAERIVKIVDFLVTNKIITEELKLRLTELRDTILSRPVTFHAMHFFIFDYTLLVSIASASVTYIVIFYQNFEY